MNGSEIWQADLGAKAGKRPVVILTRSAVIPYLNKVAVTEITSQSKGYPTEVDIDQKANLPTPSFVHSIIFKPSPNNGLRNTSAHLMMRS